MHRPFSLIAYFFTPKNIQLMIAVQVKIGWGEGGASVVPISKIVRECSSIRILHIDVIWDRSQNPSR